MSITLSRILDLSKFSAGFRGKANPVLAADPADDKDPPVDDGDDEAKKAKKAVDDKDPPADDDADDKSKMAADDADGDGDGDPEDEKDKSKKGPPVAPDPDAKKAERDRCAAIVMSAEGKAHPDLAAQLAFRTDLSATDALQALAAAGPASQSASAARAARNPNLAGGGASLGSPSSSAQVAQMWDKVHAKANPHRNGH